METDYTIKCLREELAATKELAAGWERKYISITQRVKVQIEKCKTVNPDTETFKMLKEATINMLKKLIE